MMSRRQEKVRRERWKKKRKTEKGEKGEEDGVVKERVNKGEE